MQWPPILPYPAYLVAFTKPPESAPSRCCSMHSCRITSESQRDQKTALKPPVLGQATDLATDRKLSQGTPVFDSVRGAASSRTRRAQTGTYLLDGSWHSVRQRMAVRGLQRASTAGFHRNRRNALTLLCTHTHLSVIWAGCSGVSKAPGVPPFRFLAYKAAGQVLSYLFVFMMCTLCVQAAQCPERSPEWLKGHCVQSWGLLRLHRFTWRGKQRQSVGCHQTLLPTGVPSGHTHLVLVYAKLVGVIDVFGCNASARFPLHGAV